MEDFVKRWKRIAATMRYVDEAWRLMPRPIKVALWLPVAYAARRLGLWVNVWH